MRSRKEFSSLITSSSVLPVQILLGKSEAFWKRLPTILRNLHITCCYPRFPPSPLPLSLPLPSSERLLAVLCYLFWQTRAYSIRCLDPVCEWLIVEENAKVRTRRISMKNGQGWLWRLYLVCKGVYLALTLSLCCRRSSIPSSVWPVFWGAARQNHGGANCNVLLQAQQGTTIIL